jgi:adenosylmethionine-8-amino-7-oxononanoate aminotransferase
MHLPWKKKNHEKELDWCVSLQIEGASAVFAAIDMLLQVSQLEQAAAGSSSAGEKQPKQPKQMQRNKVAVGATSYHGPASTCFGANAPIWPKEHQLIYPVPMADGSHGDDEIELLAAYQLFLDQYGDQIGVILFEPQWGSSQAALPWPPHLLQTYIGMAKRCGIKVVCDEIMCGLGRHGQGNNTLFLSQAWDLDPDAITFGKAIATGIFPLSGAIIKTGQTILKAQKCTVMQSHTYAGSSVRALMAATEVLKEIKMWMPHVARLGDEMAIIMASITKISHGLFHCQGQGLMWGGIITHHGPCRDETYRRRVIQAFKTCCDEALIVPYYVPLGGFMVSPVLDIDIPTVYEIGHRLEHAVVMTMAAVGWMVTTNNEEEEVRGDIGALFAVMDETKEESIVMA